METIVITDQNCKKTVGQKFLNTLSVSPALPLCVLTVQ